MYIDGLRGHFEKPILNESIWAWQLVLAAALRLNKLTSPYFTISRYKLHLGKNVVLHLNKLEYPAPRVICTLCGWKCQSSYGNVNYLDIVVCVCVCVRVRVRVPSMSNTAVLSSPESRSFLAKVWCGLQWLLHESCGQRPCTWKQNPSSVLPYLVLQFCRYNYYRRNDRRITLHAKDLTRNFIKSIRLWIDDLFTCRIVRGYVDQLYIKKFIDRNPKACTGWINVYSSAVNRNIERSSIIRH